MAAEPEEGDPPVLMQKESFTDRQRRRMRERKAAKLAEAAKAPKPKALSPKAAAIANEREWSATINSELAAIDRHRSALEDRLARLPEGSYERQELQRELGALAALRREIEHDRDRPITRRPDGRDLDDRDRAIRRMRAQEIAENLWAAAERAQTEGDYRRARQLRHDSLRARQVAEFELGLRKSLTGYTS